MKGIKMSGNRKQQPPQEAIQRKVPPGRVEVVSKQEANGYIELKKDISELDRRTIQTRKNLYTKVSESKAQIAKHVEDQHRDDDIYKFLAHTKRGKVLCFLFGYKTQNMRRINSREKIRKLNRKRSQIIEV